MITISILNIKKETFAKLLCKVQIHYNNPFNFTKVR